MKGGKKGHWQTTERGIDIDTQSNANKQSMERVSQQDKLEQKYRKNGCSPEIAKSNAMRLRSYIAASDQFAQRQQAQDYQKAARFVANGGKN